MLAPPVPGPTSTSIMSAENVRSVAAKCTTLWIATEAPEVCPGVVERHGAGFPAKALKVTMPAAAGSPASACCAASMISVSSAAAAACACSVSRCTQAIDEPGRMSWN